MTKKKKPAMNGRDYNIINIIKGATKSGIHKDLKKEANKTASRTKIEVEEDRCLQCGFPYNKDYTDNPDEVAAMECGYCSVSCMDYYPSEN